MKMWKSSSMCNKGSPTFPLSTSAGEQNHYRKKKNTTNITEAPVSRGNVGTTWNETCFTWPCQNTDSKWNIYKPYLMLASHITETTLWFQKFFCFCCFGGDAFFLSTFSCCVLWCSWCSIAVKSSGTSSDIHYSWCYISANHCWLSFPFILDSLAS